MIAERRGNIPTRSDRLVNLSVQYRTNNEHHRQNEVCDKTSGFLNRKYFLLGAEGKTLITIAYYSSYNVYNALAVQRAPTAESENCAETLL